MPKHIIRTNNPAYRFSAGRAAEKKRKRFGTHTEPSMPVTSGTGCVFCDIGKEPDEHGFHQVDDHTIPCKRR